MAIELLIPFMTILPPITLALLFWAADYKKLMPVAFLCALGVIYGVAFGWYGAFTYCITQIVFAGKTLNYASTEALGSGIFISWASSLPVVWLLKMNIASLRKGSSIDRMFSMTCIFYGMHLVSAAILFLIRAFYV